MALWHRLTFCARFVRAKSTPGMPRKFSILESGVKLETNKDRADRLATYADGAGPVRSFMLENFRHFNAASTVDAAIGYTDFVDEGGKMFLTLVRLVREKMTVGTFALDSFLIETPLHLWPLLGLPPVFNTGMANLGFVCRPVQ